MARRPGWYVALAVVVALGAGACGSESPLSQPSGVDELVIPTPSPDPSDFVRGVDNPWLSFVAGHQWRYKATIEELEFVRTITVLTDTERVAGVVTTVVETVTAPAGNGSPSRSRDYYAQDRRGNVWWLGREGEWRAGEDGAEAGLAMPAHPRLGDGWRMAYQPGVVDVRAVVASLDQRVTTPAGQYDGALGLDTSSPLSPGVATRSFYARGVGLVEEASIDGPISLVQLETGP